MRGKPILLKVALCCVIYLLFFVLFFFAELYLFGVILVLVLGVLCGVIMAVITRCDTPKKTTIARMAGLGSAAALQVILHMSGFPYRIILYILILQGYESVKLTGRITVNEAIGYNFGIWVFWFVLFTSFVISAGIFACTPEEDRGKEQARAVGEN